MLSLVWVGEAQHTALGKLKVSWTEFIDRGIGTAGHAATLVEAPDDVHSPNMTRPASLGMRRATQLPAMLQHAHTYYAAVLAWDELGNERWCFSDGVLFDATPPDMSGATLASRLGVNGVQPFPVQRETGLIVAEVGLRPGHDLLDPHPCCPQPIRPMFRCRCSM